MEDMSLNRVQEMYVLWPTKSWRRAFQAEGVMCATAQRH